MDYRELARLFALGRIGLAGVMLAFPGPLGSAWVGPDARSPGVAVISRALAVRDLALGLGLKLAVDRERPARGWLEAAMLADAVDFLATLRAGRRLPVLGRVGVLAMAGVATALDAWLARTLG